MASYEEALCQAMQLIAESAVKNAGYDQTIQATIVSCEDKTTGCYKVQYQDNIFLAYAADTKVNYSKGNLVYILVPNSNFDNNKTILGSVTKMGSDYIDIADERDQYEIIGNSFCANKNGDFSLSSYSTGIQAIYNVDNGIDRIGLNEFDAGTYLNDATHLMLTADIKTSIPASERYLGNYGIIVEAEFTDSSDAIVTKSYCLDVNSMSGNPYKYLQTSQQYNFYAVNGTNFKRFTKIYLFVKEFPTQKKSEEILPQDFNITISNIRLYAAKANEQNSDGYSVSFSVPEGLYFNEKVTDDKNIQAIVKAKNVALTADSNSMSYYWLIQDNSINTESAGYCVYGGRGWKCLNQYNVLQTEPEMREWLPAADTYTLSLEQASLYDNNIKVVILYNDITLEKTISIKNYASKHKVAITADNVQFYFDNGSTNLTCNVSNADDLTLNYYWVKIDSDGNETVLENNAKTITVKASDIVEHAVYQCTVYYEDTLFGTSSITLYNSLTMEGSYHIEIENGTQVFKYNNDGISPASSSLAAPQELKDLKIVLYDNLGNKVGDNLISSCPIEWVVPTVNSMLKLDKKNPDVEVDNQEIQDIYKNSLSLAIGLASIYNYNNTNNQIEAHLIYNGIRLTASTNFIFFKEGEVGTNGTDITCKIIPDTIDGKYTSPVIIYFKNQSIYPNFNSVAGSNPKFKLLMFESGEEISDVPKVTWSFLINNYGTSGGYKVQESCFYSVDENGKVTCNLTEDQQPANILQAAVTYNDVQYYATLPLITIELKSDYDATLTNGCYYVQYDSNGKNAKYDSSIPFKFNIFDGGNEVSGADDLTYTYGINGSYYNGNEWVNKTHLQIIQNKNLNKNSVLVKPSMTYQDEVINNALWCIVKKGDLDIIHFHIPIHFYLNRYGLTALNGWNGNNIEINNSGGYVLAPQVGAGKKEADNSFTGLLIGEVKESGSLQQLIGLLGFYKGERSIFLDANTGMAEFGLASQGQVRIDPSNGHAVIESGGYDEKKGIGMRIDLTDSSITFANGNFMVDKNGKLIAKEVTITGVSQKVGDDVNIGSYDNKTGYFFSGNHQTFSSTQSGFYLGNDGLSIGRKFSVDTNGTMKATSDAYVKGEIHAEEGTIGKAKEQIHIGKSADGVYSALTTLSHETLDNKTNGFYLGVDGFSFGSNFDVTPEGILTVTNAKLKGAFNLDSGVIGTGIKQIHIGSSQNNSSLYTQEHSNYNSQANGTYFGTDGLSIGKNFKVAVDGIATLDNANITGSIETTAGLIGPLKITENGVYSQAHSAYDNNDSGTYIGSDGISVGSKFRVNNEGILQAENANISGVFTTGLEGEQVILNSGLYSEGHSNFEDETAGFYLGNDGLSIGDKMRLNNEGDIAANNITATSINLGAAGNLTSDKNFDMILSGKLNMKDVHYDGNKGLTQTIQIIDSITINKDEEGNITVLPSTKELTFNNGGLVDIKQIGVVTK